MLRKIISVLLVLVIAVSAIAVTSISFSAAPTESPKQLPMIDKLTAGHEHTLVFVEEVPATEKADGVKAHYVCEICGKLFEDALGTVELTEADLVIPKIIPIEPTDEPIEPTTAPMTQRPTQPPTEPGPIGDNIIIDADGDKYEVEAGTAHNYSFYLNNRAVVSSLDATTTWDITGILIDEDQPTFPILGESDDFAVNNSNVAAGIVIYNYSNTEGMWFDEDKCQVITFSFFVPEDTNPGTYKIRTNIKTLTGYNEKRQIVNGVDLVDFDRKEGVLDGEEPFEKSRQFTTEPQTYTLGSGEDVTFHVSAKDGYVIEDGEFVGITVDDESVECTYIINDNGNLEVTLPAEYLETLEVRDYTVEFIFTDGFVTESLSIICSPEINPTGPTEYHNPADKCIIHFDAASAGWSGNTILFYIYDLDADKELAAWGSKKLAGTADGDIYSFDAATIGIEHGKQYLIIFNNKYTNAETYQLLMDTTCDGDTAYCTGNRIENPVDSTKTSIEVRWQNSRLGPRLMITSIGNVIGDTCPANTTRYDMFLNFLTSTGKDSLQNAMNYNPGKTQQEIIDQVASGLGLSDAEKRRAMQEAGIIAPTEPPTQYNYGLIGDVDDNGKVEVVDAAWIQRDHAHKDIAITISVKTADVDGDGEVTLIDATYIQRWLAEYTIPYPVGEKRN